MKFTSYSLGLAAMLVCATSASADSLTATAKEPTTMSVTAKEPITLTATANSRDFTATAESRDFSTDDIDVIGPRLPARTE